MCSRAFRDKANRLFLSVPFGTHVTSVAARVECSVGTSESSLQTFVYASSPEKVNTGGLARYPPLSQKAVQHILVPGQEPCGK